MTTNDQVKLQSMRKPFAIGLALLMAGIVIGVVVDRIGHRPQPSATTTAYIPAPLVASTLASGPIQCPAPAGNCPAPAPASAQWSAWDPFREMQAMQAEMDRLFERSFARAGWPVSGLPSARASGADDLASAVSFDVRDLKDRYEVHAALPDAKTAETKVSLDGRRLSVIVEHRRTEKNGPTDLAELGHYEQVIQLAGDVKSDGMKVERKDRELLITIPKTMS